MDYRVALDIVARERLDIRCLTRLLLTGDKSLKTLLVQNVRTLSQYYQADPRVFVWVWPYLAFHTFVNAIEVVLVTPRPAGLKDHHQVARRSLEGCDFYHLPAKIVRLKLMCDGCPTYQGMKLLYPKLTDINIYDHVRERMEQFLPVIKGNMLISGAIMNVRTAQNGDTSMLKKLVVSQGFTTPSWSLLVEFFTSPLPNLTTLHLLNITSYGIDIGILPSTLHNLRLYTCVLKNYHAIRDLPLVDLSILDCRWTESTPSNPVTVECPPTLLVLEVTNNPFVFSVDSRNIYLLSSGKLIDLTITPCSDRVKMMDGVTMKCLTKLTAINSRFAMMNAVQYHGPGLMGRDIIDILASTAGNLRELVIIDDDFDRSSTLLRKIGSMCPHLTELEYLQSIHNGEDRPNAWSLLFPPPNLTRLSTNLMFVYEVQLLPSCSKLRQLSLTVKLGHLPRLNDALKNISSLEELRLRIYLVKSLPITSNYYVRIVIPPSLLALSMEPLEEYGAATRYLYFSFIGTAEHPSGIPPGLKVLELLKSSLGSRIICLHSGQVDELPTSLERFDIGEELTNQQRVRLHNLVVD